jgi:DNA-directed RNA polymerase beta subunit
MEMACLTGHDASANLFEFLTTKSDCIDLKNEFIRTKIDSDFMKDDKEQSIIPESVRLLNAYLKAIGVER